MDITHGSYGEGVKQTHAHWSKLRGEDGRECYQPTPVLHWQLLMSFPKFQLLWPSSISIVLLQLKISYSYLGQKSTVASRYSQANVPCVPIRQTDNRVCNSRSKHHQFCNHWTPESLIISCAWARPCLVKQVIKMPQPSNELVFKFLLWGSIALAVKAVLSGIV